MKRAALFVVLLAVYAAFLGRRVDSDDVPRMDAVGPRAREVEAAIAAKRFADALPVALELQDAYPLEPVVSLWLTSIYRGLDRAPEEAAAWERFIALGSTPAEACPGLADAYARIGKGEQGIRTYERCVALDPGEPERLVDLANAFERAGKLDKAVETYRRIADLDPNHPIVARRANQASHGREARP